MAAPLLSAQQKIVVIDLGSAHNQLLTRTIRELGMYSELHVHTTTAEQIQAMNAAGVILSGGTLDVIEKYELTVDPNIFKLDIPVLAISSGVKEVIEQFGGAVQKRDVLDAQEEIQVPASTLYEQQSTLTVQFVEQYEITNLPTSFERLAGDDVIANDEAQVYGVQYHPELSASEGGKELLKRFIYDICKATDEWTMKYFVDMEVERIRSTVGDKNVLCALSGGVDSSVVAALVHKAIGNQLTCIFVDHGLLRKGEADSVVETFQGKFNMNFIKVDAKDRFLGKLKGVTDPEQKRKIIGNEFICQ